MAKDEQFILTLTKNGFAKRSSAYEYRVTHRGGSGVVNIITSERNGNVVASMPIEPDDHLLMITNKGTVIRCPVRDVRISGRATQGVTVFRTSGSEYVVSAEKIPGEEEEQDEQINENGEVVIAEGAEIS